MALEHDRQADGQLLANEAQHADHVTRGWRGVSRRPCLLRTFVVARSPLNAGARALFEDALLELQAGRILNERQVGGGLDPAVDVRDHTHGLERPVDADLVEPQSSSRQPPQRVEERGDRLVEAVVRHDPGDQAHAQSLVGAELAPSEQARPWRPYGLPSRAP